MAFYLAFNCIEIQMEEIYTDPRSPVTFDPHSFAHAQRTWKKSYDLNYHVTFIEHHKSNVGVQYMSCELFHKDSNFLTYYSPIILECQSTPTYYSQKDASIIIYQSLIVAAMKYVHRVEICT